jgi:hypothetical protein
MADSDANVSNVDGVEAGGKPSKGTPKDKRLKGNSKVSGTNIGRTGAGKVTRG